MSRSVTSAFIRTSLGVLRSIYSPSHFCIKAGYFHRTKVPHFDDTGNADEWQLEVYQYAAGLMREKGYSKVLDVGCGSAHKLLKYMGMYQTIGVEVGETLAFLRNTYPERDWMSLDQADAKELRPDLVICADVIEHLADPELLVNQLKAIATGSDIILSTPERDLKRGYWHYGPPPNPYHVREWNKKELTEFLGAHFQIIEHTISNHAQATQMVVCKG